MPLSAPATGRGAKSTPPQPAPATIPPPHLSTGTPPKSAETAAASKPAEADNTVAVPVSEATSETASEAASEAARAAARETVGGGRLSQWLSMGRESLWVAIGQGSAALAGVVGIRLLAERMTPEEYGQLALAMTFASLAQHVAIGPISGAITRHYSAALETNRLGALRVVVRRLMGQSVAAQAAVGIFAAAVLYGCGLRTWAILTLAATLYSVCATVADVLRALPVAARQRPRAAIHMGAGHWGRILLAALFVTGSALPAAAALGGYALASVIIAISLFWYWGRDQRDPGWQQGNAPAEVAGLNRQLVGYLTPLATCAAFLWVQAAAPRWALKAFTGDAAVGQYAALFQLGWYPVTLFGMLCMELGSPWLFRMAGDGSDPERLARAARWNTCLVGVVIGCSLVGAGLAWLTYAPVFAMIAQESYQAAAPLLPLMVLAAGLHTAAEAQSLRLWTAMRTRSLLSPKIWTAAATLLFSSIGAAAGGMSGVVIAQTVTAAGYLAVMIVATRTPATDERGI